MIIGLNSFFLFLLAFPFEALEALVATCFAFCMAAALIWDPFMAVEDRGAVVRGGVMRMRARQCKAEGGVDSVCR